MQGKRKAAIVCCSNGRPQSDGDNLVKLEQILRQTGICPVFSDCIFEKKKGEAFSGTARQRAEALMNFYKDEEIEDIFDISGGDIANEILPYLDFSVIAKSRKLFWGYSDLTVILNAIYAKTGRPSALYQVRNLIGDCGKRQVSDFGSSATEQTGPLFSFSYRLIQGRHLKGTVIGGNIRCLLKLAGTSYWPDMNKKVLLLEARSGTAAQMTAYLSQLQQIGVFGQISGLLLGTFTQLERERGVSEVIELIRQYAGASLPIAKTKEIGHGADSKAVMIGRDILLQ